MIYKTFSLLPRVLVLKHINTQTTVVIYIFRACFSTSCRYSEVLIETFNSVSFDIFYICNIATKQ
jgi:hypothetical protein